MKLRRVEASASAKVNIGWRVGALREDGYHDVRGLMQTISLEDHLTFEATDGEGVRVLVPGHPDLEAESNLVHAASRAIAEHADPVATTVTIDKRIPVAGGLGGGSADAAAALLAFNVLWGADLSARKLVELGAGISSDVPAILVGGLVHAAGRGERVRRIGSTSGYSFVIGISDARIAAADAYRALDGIDARDAQPDDRLERNDLEAAACVLLPGLADRVAAMREAAEVAFVSGSGPTVVGMTHEPDVVVAHVRRVFERIEVAEPTDAGVRLELHRDV